MDENINSICMSKWIIEFKKEMEAKNQREVGYSELSRHLGIPVQTIQDWEKRKDYTFGGLHSRNQEKLKKLFPHIFGTAMILPSMPKQEEAKHEQFEQLLFPILEIDRQQKGVTKYAYAKEILGVPLSTYYKWQEKKYFFSQLRSEHQRRLAERFPDKFRIAAMKNAVVELRDRAPATAPILSDATANAIIVQYEITKLVPLLEGFIRGSEEDRKVLRAKFNENEWKNFMNLVTALSSEKAREVAIQDKRIKL